MLIYAYNPNCGRRQCGFHHYWELHLRQLLQKTVAGELPSVLPAKRLHHRLW